MIINNFEIFQFKTNKLMDSQKCHEVVGVIKEDVFEHIICNYNAKKILCPMGLGYIKIHS